VSGHALVSDLGRLGFLLPVLFAFLYKI